MLPPQIVVLHKQPVSCSCMCVVRVCAEWIPWAPEQSPSVPAPAPLHGWAESPGAAGLLQGGNLHTIPSCVGCSYGAHLQLMAALLPMLSCDGPGLCCAIQALSILGLGCSITLHAPCWINSLVHYAGTEIAWEWGCITIALGPMQQVLVVLCNAGTDHGCNWWAAGASNKVFIALWIA